MTTQMKAKYFMAASESQLWLRVMRPASLAATRHCPQLHLDSTRLSFEKFSKGRLG